VDEKGGGRAYEKGGGHQTIGKKGGVQGGEMGGHKVRGLEKNTCPWRGWMGERKAIHGSGDKLVGQETLENRFLLRKKPQRNGARVKWS